MVNITEWSARPLLRGWSHAVAAVLSIPAGVFLIADASGAAASATVAIYSAALLTMFATSAAYHRTNLVSHKKSLMQRLDHCGIYLLILGTYVPLCVLALPSSWGIPLLSVITAAAIVGIALKLGPFQRSRTIGFVLYLAMGWAAVVAVPVLLTTLSTLQFALVVAGGVAYTAGFPVLALKRPNPWPKVFGYHEIWHGFTIVGATLHFSAIANLIR